MRPASKKDDEGPQTGGERLAALRNVHRYCVSVWETSRTLSFLPSYCDVLRGIRSPRYGFRNGSSISWSAPSGRVNRPVRYLETLGFGTSCSRLRRYARPRYFVVDSLLGDRFTNQVSLKLMAHATALDLVFSKIRCFRQKWNARWRQTTPAWERWRAWPGMAQQLLTLLSLLSAVISSIVAFTAVGGRHHSGILGETRFRHAEYQCCIGIRRNGANSIICVF